jgi:hypothetical protein
MFKKVAGVLVGVAPAGLAFAQSDALDVTSITGALASAGTGIGTVALAMLAVAGAGIAVKWFLGWLFS